MLQLGSAGPEVVALQTFLNAQGCRDDNGAALKVDGSFGARTGQALRAFQRRESLTPDGVFGPKTEAAAAALGFGKTTRIEGVDVSLYCTDGHGHSHIEWDDLVPRPAFFWARSSAGLTADTSRALHYEEGSAIGAVPGAYHFFSAQSDPVKQAAVWLAAAGAQAKGVTLRPAIDIESNRVEPLTDDEAKLWATNARVLVLEAERRFARELVVYINPKTAYEMRRHLDAAFWGARLLWLAQYTSRAPNIPAPWTKCAAHQFAGDVAMPGATCRMDRNVIYDQASFDLLKT